MAAGASAGMDSMLHGARNVVSLAGFAISQGLAVDRRRSTVAKRMMSVVVVASAVAASSPAWAAYDVETSGILRFRRNAGAQSCPRNFKLVCLNRTRIVSPDQSENCGNFANATCANTATSLATDTYCVCRH